MRQNRMKFGRDWKVEFKKSLKLYQQSLLKVLRARNPKSEAKGE